MPRLFIIDGHAQIYRAYFAPFPPLTSPSGEPTKATFVFSRMLLNLVAQQKPDYLVLVADSPGGCAFRRELFPEYKANRPPRPDDLDVQEKRIFELVGLMGIPLLRQVGDEADDLIATLVRKVRDMDLEVFLVSRDKDLRQLLSPKVHFFDGIDQKVIRMEDVVKDVGFTPEQAVEVQTLCGDPVDNIKGVEGVGEKTAAKLIRQYGTAENVVAHAGELTPKLKENVLAAAPRLAHVRSLVRLRDDVPIDFDLERLRTPRITSMAVGKRFEELGFGRLLSAFPALPRPASGLFAAAATPEPAAEPAQGPPASPVAAPVEAAGVEVFVADRVKYHLVDDAAALASFARELAAQKRFAFDTETTALGAMHSSLVGMSCSWKKGEAFYLPVRGPFASRVLSVEAAIAAVRGPLEDAAKGKVGHHLKYDINVLRRLDVRVKGFAMDTMLAAWLLDASRLSYSLDSLALSELSYRKITTQQIIGSGRKQTSMDAIDPRRVADYACEDADMTWRLFEVLSPAIARDSDIARLLRDVEMPLLEVLADMEYRGISINIPELKRQSHVLGEEIQSLRQEITRAAGIPFNPDSPKQLAAVLFDRLQLRRGKANATGSSTDAEVLEDLASEHPLPALVLRYRGLTKLRNTYLDALPEHVSPVTGRVHASFMQTGTETGRLSCTDPNLQNIPIRSQEGGLIRNAFVPSAGGRVLLVADYSQVELRVLAHFSREPALLAAFARGDDIHRAVAAEVFGVAPADVTREQRSHAKTINFGIIYGVSAWGLSRQVKGMSVAEADRLITSYHARFPGIRAFIDQVVEQARHTGSVRTILGRRRAIPQINSTNTASRHASERMAVNTVVQGSAADLIKLAMIRLASRISQENLPLELLLQVHDELVFEVPANRADELASVVRQEMTQALSLDVPIEVQIGIGPSWGEAKGE